MGSGLYTDNSPPTDACCAILAAWNARHGDRVRIEVATLADFADHLVQHAGDVPTVAGDWPDWWADGVASTPVDTQLFRHAQRGHRTLRRLGVTTDDAAITHALALAAEHTYGHSSTEGGALLTQQVFRRKSAMAVAADERVGRAIDAAAPTFGEGAFTARRPMAFNVVNALDAAVTASVALPLDSWEQPTIEQGFRVVDADGRAYAHQIEPSPRGWLASVVATLAARERRAFRVVPRAAEVVPQSPAPSGRYENDFYRVEWSLPRGITALTERSTVRNTLDPGAAVGLGGPVYQFFPGADRGAPAAFNFAPRRIPTSRAVNGQCVAIRPLQSGPVFVEIAFDYAIPATIYYRVVARLFHALPRIELRVEAHKLDVADPEGLYAAFPFQIDRGVWHLDRAGGALRPGVDQLPGTCCDYYLVQDGAALIGPELTVLLATLDVPLVHVGGLNLWKYTTAREATGPLYSWLTNNRWETNFPRYCGGNYAFDYAIELRPLMLAAADVGPACATMNEPPLVWRK